jgi:predicted  nucleic acid-binding Zn-ribbon protein
MENFKDQIKLLVELQGLDGAIFALEDKCDEIPHTVKNKEEQFKDKAIDLKKAEDDLKVLLLKRKEKEGELEAKEGTIKKYQQQLNQVKTNKEYSALQDEIGRVKADNSIIEEAILNIFDEIDVGNKKIAKEKDVLKSEEAKLGEEKKKLNEELTRIKTELEGMKSQRNALAAKVDKEILKKYERIVKNKDGLAIVTIVDDVCQGCFSTQPPQVVNEVKISQSLVFCDSCARILYVEE